MFTKIKDYLKKTWGWGGYGQGAGGPYTFLLSTMNSWGPFGSGVNNPWKYDMYSWLGYMSNPIVNRCVNMISNAVAGIPWKLYRKTVDGKDHEIEEHPVLELLKKPNPMLSENDFFSHYVYYLTIAGNVYVYRVGPNHGAPKELYFLRPDRVLILNATEGIGGSCDIFDFLTPIYEYACGTSRSKLDNNLLHHGKNFNPLNDFYGLSPLQAAATSIDQNNEALLWNVNLLRNAASPTGILSTENNLGDEQIYRLKEQMNQKYQGPYNSGRPMLLEGGLKWDKVGMTPKEMDWTKGMKESSKNIALTLGVDPSLVGDGDHKTFNTFNDAQRSFYTETVIPLCDKIRDDFLNKWLLPLFPNTKDMYFQYDLEAVEVMNEDRTIIWKRVIEGLESGIITTDEAREAIGYEALEAAYEQENPMDTDVMNEEKQFFSRRRF
jgi:HK97 family phage portal protein